MGIIMRYLFKDEYKYHDSPDGQDCLDKIWFVTKYACFYGIGGSALDVILRAQTKGAGETALRFAYLTLPLMGMGAAFAATTCIATDLRKKDDVLNYTFGGISAGGVLGVVRKSVKYGCYGAVGFAFFATVYKDLISKDLFITDVLRRKANTNLYALKRDYSLTQDPGRTWKTSSEV